jgi:microcin C transport system substrate-binding protein
MVARYLFAALVWIAAATSASAEPRHGLSTFGELKYPADFTNFDYVNPDAPKGGSLSMIGTGNLITFDSFNGFILKGNPAQGLEYLFDTLMTRAGDEPDAIYGLVAHSAEVAEDGMSATFFLRPEAEFSDGTPVRAIDVVRAFEIIKADGHPFLAMPLRDVVSAEALDELTVRYTFTGSLTRDLPLLVAQLPVLSSVWYENNDFTTTNLTPPLGSGPYVIDDYQLGRSVTYRLREDYWARDLPVNRGRFNFGELRYEYYRDPTAEFEALKAGEYDLREEFTSRNWATGYDVASVRDGLLNRVVIPDERVSGAQGFFLNTRLEKFSDPVVREALALAFDFEWTNRNQFYDLYVRTGSFFENSSMKAEGVPGADELALLEPWRGQIPESVFGEVVTPPVTDGSGQDRSLLRQASNLLNEAGWTIVDGKRQNDAGEVFEIEFIILSPTWERVVAPYVKNLVLLGIDATIRRIDPAQFEERIKTFDFDIVTQRYVIGTTPGAELRNYWSSDAANTQGSRNLSGISSPAIDAMIEAVIGATSRAELETATRALDRLLRAGHYWVPHWFKNIHTIAFWDRFSWPDIKPQFERGVIETWWYDSDKADRLESLR